jgi:hypothetical protein
VGAKGFVVLPKRWIVERTFAWLARCRRHSKEYRIERNDDLPLDDRPHVTALGTRTMNLKTCSKKMVGKLGNLILLDGLTNKKPGNKDFVSKVKLLQRTQVFLDKKLKNATKWEDAEIAVRTKTLAKLAYDEI